jgi:hypothetical protein
MYKYQYKKIKELWRTDAPFTVRFRRIAKKTMQSNPILWYFQNLWTSSTDEELKHLESSNFQTDDITIFEVNTVLKELKNQQITRQ